MKINNIKRRILSFGLTLGLFIGVAVAPAHAEWKQDSTGWWYAKNNSYSIGWDQIDGTWYCFNSKGYMKTGWVQYDGTWYYLSSSGALDNSKTTRTMPTLNYTYEQCKGIADAWFNNTHESGYKFKVGSDQKLYDNGAYYFTIYSSDGSKKIDFFGVNAITGEIIE